MNLGSLRANKKDVARNLELVWSAREISGKKEAAGTISRAISALGSYSCGHCFQLASPTPHSKVPNVPIHMPRKPMAHCERGQGGPPPKPCIDPQPSFRVPTMCQTAKEGTGVFVPEESRKIFPVVIRSLRRQPSKRRPIRWPPFLL